MDPLDLAVNPLLQPTACCSPACRTPAECWVHINLSAYRSPSPAICVTVEALLSHTPPSHEKCMGYEGLWEDRERLHARLAGIYVPNVMKGINGQSKGIGKSLGMT